MTHYRRPDPPPAITPTQREADARRIEAVAEATPHNLSAAELDALLALAIERGWPSYQIAAALGGEVYQAHDLGRAFGSAAGEFVGGLD